MSAVVLQAPAGRDAEVMALVGLAHGTSHFFHLLLPTLSLWLMRDFGLGFTETGALMTVFFVVSALGQAASGFLVDRYGARPVLFLGLAALGASGLLLAAAGNYPMLVVVAVVAGLGNAVFHPADFTLLNHLVRPSRLGHAFSVHGLAGNLGWAVAPVALTAVAAAADWHLAGLVAAALGFGVLGVLWVRRHSLVPAAAGAAEAEGGSARARAAAPPQAALAFLAVPAVWVCFLFFFFSTGAFGILQNFAPAVLGHLYGLPPAAGAASLSAFLLGGAFGMAAGGFLAARVERCEQVIGVALAAAAAVALVLAAGVLPAAAVPGAMFAMGLGTGSAGPSRDLLVRRAATARFGREAFGRVYGFVYAGLDLGLATAPLVFGPVLDRGHFSPALVGVAIMLGLALASARVVGAITGRSPAHS